jgi:hypothetical protein
MPDFTAWLGVWKKENAHYLKFERHGDSFVGTEGWERNWNTDRTFVMKITG